MSEKKNISAEQAYSLIKTMVQCGAKIVVNDGMSDWTIEDKGAENECLVMDHIVQGFSDDFYASRKYIEETNSNGIESAVIVNDTLEIKALNGEKYNIDFFPPKFMIGKVVKSDGADVTPMDIFNTFVKPAPVILSND